MHILGQPLDLKNSALIMLGAVPYQLCLLLLAVLTMSCAETGPAGELCGMLWC